MRWNGGEIPHRVGGARRTMNDLYPRPPTDNPGAQLWAAQRVSADLAAALTLKQIADATAEALAMVGADAGSLWLRSERDNTLERLCSTGDPPPPFARIARLPITLATPLTDAVRTGEPLLLGEPTAWSAYYPEIASTELGSYRSLLVVPLLATGQVLGALSLSYQSVRPFEQEGGMLIWSLGQQFAAAVLRARLFTELHEQVRAVDEQARESADTLAWLSHELQRQLTFILGYTGLLQARWSRVTTAQRRDYLAKITMAAQRLRRLLDNLLLLGQDGKWLAVLEPISVLLSEVLREAVEETRSSYRSVLIEWPGPPTLCVFAEQDRLREVLVNLLDNAAKYSPEGGLVRVAWHAAGDIAVLRVRDHGPGVPEADRTHLLSRGGRLSGSPPRRGQIGPGLGLYVSRKLAEAMGGGLVLEESGSLGSTFRLCLPLVPVP